MIYFKCNQGTNPKISDGGKQDEFDLRRMQEVQWQQCRGCVALWVYDAVSLA